MPGFVDLQVNGFAGVDFLGADADGFAARRRSAAGDRRDGLPAHADHLRRDRPASLRSRGPRDADRGPRILGVHLEGPFLSPRGSGRIVSQRAAIPTRRSSSGCWPPAGAPRDARAGAARRADLVDLLPRARRRRLPRPLDASAAEAHAAFDRGRPRGDARVQRDAPARTPRPRHRGRGPRPPRRPSPGDRRRRPPRPRHRAARSGASARAGSRSSPTRSPGRGSATEPTRSARSRSSSPTTWCGARTGCSRAAR